MTVTIRMSPFPAWRWDVADAATGIVVKRFKTDAQLEAWLARHAVR